MMGRRKWKRAPWWVTLPAGSCSFQLVTAWSLPRLLSIFHLFNLSFFTIPTLLFYPEIRKLSVLRQVATWLLAHTAQFFTMEELAAKTGIAKVTAATYLDVLEAL